MFQLQPNEMSERVCQFFIRGRCQREQHECEFKHVLPEKSSVENKEVQEQAIPVVARKV